MARALIVGCGCRGRELGSRLMADGWQVRGTSRTQDGVEAIQGAGLEGVLADPDRPGTVLDHVGDVTAIGWLLGSASGDPELVAGIHGARLERVLEKLVDTAVRGFVYEGAGEAPSECLVTGAAAVRAAADRWRIPVELIDADPTDAAAWAAAMAQGFGRLIA